MNPRVSYSKYRHPMQEMAKRVLATRKICTALSLKTIPNSWEGLSISSSFSVSYIGAFRLLNNFSQYADEKEGGFLEWNL